VQYAFLADFDLLRETREDVRERAWARPAARVAMDQHFRIIRAEEEIARLNIEICRVITHLHDEEKFLHAHEDNLRPRDSALAHQLRCYRLQRGRFNALHQERFRQLGSMPGFTGSLEPGNAAEKTLLTAINPVDEVDPTANGMNPNNAPQICPEQESDNRPGRHDEQDDDEEEYLQIQLDIITALQD